MTPDILQNELVRKYFGEPYRMMDDWAERMALDVLRAMQEPIRKGEKLLHILNARDITEITLDHDFKGDLFHPDWLRLPSRFQPPPESKGTEQMPEVFLRCDNCRKMYEHSCPGSFKPAEAEKPERDQHAEWRAERELDHYQEPTPAVEKQEDEVE